MKCSLVYRNVIRTVGQMLVRDNNQNRSFLSKTNKLSSRCTDWFYSIFLQKYDYDSSTVRKRIFQEALVSITLPFIKKSLVSTCKTVRALSFSHTQHNVFLWTLHSSTSVPTITLQLIVVALSTLAYLNPNHTPNPGDI